MPLLHKNEVISLSHNFRQIGRNKQTFLCIKLYYFLIHKFNIIYGCSKNVSLSWFFPITTYVLVERLRKLISHYTLLSSSLYRSIKFLCILRTVLCSIYAIDTQLNFWWVSLSTFFRVIKLIPVREVDEVSDQILDL